MAALGEVMGGVVSPRLTSTIWQTVGVEIAPHIENKFNYGQVMTVMVMMMMMMIVMTMTMMVMMMMINICLRTCKTPDNRKIDQQLHKKANPEKSRNILRRSRD